MKHASTGTNYAILTQQVKVQHEKKPVSNLKSMQIAGFETNTLKIYWDFCSVRIVKANSDTVETISVVINDSSNVICSDLYLKNIFVKRMKAERCTDIRVWISKTKRWGKRPVFWYVNHFIKSAKSFN